MIENAFLFPGQGSQFVGMGKLLADEFPEARQVFKVADNALGFSLSELCFGGPEERLQQTEYTQPALLTVSVAALRVLQAQGIKADVVAGHSLGEYSALVAAESLAFEDAVVLVHKRGRLMQDAVPQGVGAMAAILKLDEQALPRILDAAAQGETVSAANLNSPDQIVIAGHKGAVERAMELAKAAGAKRAILLPVSAPFHCPLMLPAQNGMRAELEVAAFHDLAIPLVNNWRARLVSSGSDAREGLYEQIPNPVLWTESMRQLAVLGVRRFVEVGPKAVLNGLCRAIEPSLDGFKFGEPADLEKVKLAFSSRSMAHSAPPGSTPMGSALV